MEQFAKTAVFGGVLSLCLCLIGVAQADEVLFEKDIRPILKEHCFHCHGEEADHVEAGLDVRLRRFLEKGGESGPAIVPGDAGKSLLLKVLKSGDMPKEKSRLPDSQIALIETWIKNGAPTARPEPETLGPEHLFTEEERSWWSFQPIRKPEVPSLVFSDEHLVTSDENSESSKEAKQTTNNSTLKTKNYLLNTKHSTLITHPIDAFIAEKLAEKKLTFSPEADPVALIRRATYDFIGLPPKPEEVVAFVEASKTDPDGAFNALD